jgi:hypothetical protein
MIKYLKLLPGAAFVFGSILYFFGFVCFSSFLGCFGISSFEIINARFIIAGFFPFFSFLIVIFIIWFIQENGIDVFIHLFDDEKRFLQSAKHLYFILIVFAISGGIEALFNLGKNIHPLSLQELAYKPRPFNYVGAFINKLSWNLPTGLNYLLKFTLNLFVIILALSLLFWLLAWGIEKFFPSKKTKEMNATEIVPPVEKSKKEMNIFQKLLFRSISIFITCFEVALLSYSYLKLSTSIISINSLNDMRLPLGLIFSWLYGLSASIYIFLAAMEINFSKGAIINSSTVAKLRDNPYLMFQVGIIPILTFLIFFGQTIFPRISYTIGGGEPREVLLKTKIDAPLFNKIGNYKTFYIGESSQAIYVAISGKDTNKICQINRDEIQYIETR